MAHVAGLLQIHLCDIVRVVEKFLSRYCISQRVQSTYIVEYRVSILGITVVVWGRVPRTLCISHSNYTTGGGRTGKGIWGLI